MSKKTQTTATVTTPASAALPPAPDAKVQYMLVAPAKLHYDVGYNVRNFDPARNPADGEMVNSVRANGVLKPLVIRPMPGKAGEFYIVEGHRRFGAVTANIEAGIAFPRIPAVLEKAGTTPVERTFGLFLSNQASPLEPIEKGEACLRLERYGVGIGEIARRLGVTDRAVRGFITLAKADKRIVGAVKSRLLSETEALKIISQAGQDAPEVAAEAVKAAQGRGKAAATGQDTITAMAKVAARKGAPLTTARGKVSQNAKTAAQTAKMAAKTGATAVPAAPAASAPVVSAPVPAASVPARPASPDRIAGPFIGQTDLVLTKGGAVLATCANASDAKIVAHMLTLAWNNMTDKQREAIQPGAVNAPVTVTQPPVKASVPVKGRSAGKGENRPNA